MSNSATTLRLKQIRILVAMAVVSVGCFLLNISSADASNSTLKTEYIFSSNNLHLPSQIGNKTNWTPFNSQKNNLSPRKGEQLWLKVSVRHPEGGPITLKFDKIFMRFKIFSADDSLIYSFGEEGEYAGFPPHLVTLNTSEEQKEVFMRIESDHQRIGPVGNISVGHRADFIVQMIRSDLIPLFVSSILALLSIAGLTLFVMHRNVRTYLSLALFSACAFFYLVAGLRMRQQLGLNPAVLGNVSFLALFASPIFFIQFYIEIFSIKKNFWFKSAIHANLIFIACSIIGSFRSPLGLLPFLNWFYALALPTFAGIFIHSLFKIRSHVYSRTFYLGFFFLFLGGFWEMANELRIINSNTRMLHVGLLLFFLCLTAMQGQFFSNLFRISRKNELAEIAARNRLQRVFDCTYALAQARHYRDALHAVVIAISNQLNLSNADCSIDFMISHSAVSDSKGNGNELLHFTYINNGKNQHGEIYEVRASGSDKPVNSLIPTIMPSPQHSLPVVEPGDSTMLNFAPAEPASVFTIPLETNTLDGAIVIRRYDSSSFAREEHQQVMQFINAVSASLMIALKNIEYLRDVRKRAQLEAQLDAAESLQNALLPTALSLDRIALASYAHSAGKTGGDWFGHFYSEKRSRLFVTIGDVTGHDFAASILTGVAAGIIKSWELYNSDYYESAAEALERLAEHVNAVMLDASRGLKFMTMIFVCIELDSGLCHIVNAGHPHPFHVIPQQRPEVIVASGSILGANPDVKYTSSTLELNPRESIILYTDGLVENTGPNGEVISRRAIIQYCARNSLNAKNLNSFVNFTQEIWKNHPAEDDVSVVAITWKPEEVAPHAAA